MLSDSPDTARHHLGIAFEHPKRKMCTCSYVHVSNFSDSLILCTGALSHVCRA